MICLKCLDKRPHRRYATAAALADDLERCVVGRPIQGRSVGRAERLWLWCRRQPVTVALIAVLVLVIVLSAGAAVLLRQADADREHDLKKAKTDRDLALEKDAEDRNNLRYLHRIWEASALLREGDVGAAKHGLEEMRAHKPAHRVALHVRPYYYGKPILHGVPQGYSRSGGRPWPDPPQNRQIRFAADSSRVVILEDDELKVLRTSERNH